MEVYRKRVFPVLAGLLWLVFLTLDLTRAWSSTWVKFAAICLCCVTALLGAKTTDGKVVAAALCFTVAADWFLLVRNDHYGVGIGLFIVVQALYAYRLYLLRGKKICRWGLVLRLLSLIGVLLITLTVFLLDDLIADAFGGNLNLLSLLLAFIGHGLLFLIPPLFYFSNLCVNAAEAFALKKPLFGVGLLLFICCDLCVGVYNLAPLTGFTWWGSWLFYLPSQVLIVLSQE